MLSWRSTKWLISSTFLGSPCCTASQLSGPVESASSIPQAGQISVFGSWSWYIVWILRKSYVGGGHHFGGKTCKRAGMGYQRWWWVPSLFWGQRRWILCVCRHFSLHSQCLCAFKYFKVGGALKIYQCVTQKNSSVSHVWLSSVSVC